ncbi:1,3-propanediol dehydrogenase [Priestia megaterium Q3]|uniref:1,3-propanediol dehydrogenase n=1 Tax=Priestia megaterium Q3 TaxID=1452722 RepID=A0A806U098_PRIMG|nr:iron-containing alcohol dehydrogenase [Priestia megaterium]AKP77656.1 1,3-propanediol dehydrogenase [Priestia megaterium Q3]
MGIYELLVPRTVLYGEGSFSKIGEQAALLGTKALLISDDVMAKAGNVETCRRYLAEAGMDCAVYTGVNSEPTDIHLDEALAICKTEKCDVVIALGGGSCIDTGKAVAIMMTNEGHLRTYFQNQQDFQGSPLPLVAVPTTAGTGSEVTKATVITDTAYDVKMMLARPQLLPDTAIVDPLLTLSCPKHVTAATGIDALSHAVEAYLSKKAHPFTDSLALQAIELIMKNIRLVYRNGENVQARNEMAYASMLAGMAFSNSSVALVHGMSRPIGALFHVPHGISNAMLLPAVLDYTKEASIDRLGEIGQALFPNVSYTKKEGADVLIEAIKQLCIDLEIPNLQSWGIDRQLFYAAVEKMAADAIQSGSPANHPVVPTAEEIIQLYYTSYEYEFKSALYKK